MLPAFLEGVRSLVQPCTVLLVAPIVAVVVAAGARWSAVAAAVGAAVVGGWNLAGGWWFLHGDALRIAGAVFVGIVGLLIAARGDERLRRFDRPAARAALVAVASVLATLWWRPCVGDELGAILTASQDGMIGQVPGMTAYMLGTLLPVIAVGFARELVPAGGRVRVAAGVSATTFAVVLGTALVLGRHADLVGTLTRWSEG